MISSGRNSITSVAPSAAGPIFYCKNHTNKKIKYFDRAGKTFCCSACIFEYEISKKNAQATSEDDIVAQGEVLADMMK